MWILPTYPKIGRKKTPGWNSHFLAESSSQDLEFAKNRAIDKLCLGRYGRFAPPCVPQKGTPSAKHLQGIRRNNRVQRHSTHWWFKQITLESGCVLGRIAPNICDINRLVDIVKSLHLRRTPPIDATLKLVQRWGGKIFPFAMRWRRCWVLELADKHLMKFSATIIRLD